MTVWDLIEYVKDNNLVSPYHAIRFEQNSALRDDLLQTYMKALWSADVPEEFEELFFDKKPRRVSKNQPSAEDKLEIPSPAIDAFLSSFAVR